MAHAWHQPRRVLCPEQRFESFLSSQCNPVIYVPNVRQRFTAVRSCWLVIRWPVLRGECRKSVTTFSLYLPNHIPPPLKTLHIWNPFGSPWIAHLRPMIISYSAVDMIRLVCNLLNDTCQVWIICVSLGNRRKMRQICNEFEIRKLWQKIAAHPR